jgi:tellurite resistance protein
LRETALCFAMRIALADGKIEEGEKASLAQTAAHMEIPLERFQQIFDVVAIMQRPPSA